MADFTTINQEIDNNIKQNGVNAITGQKLNTVLKDMMSAVNTEKQDTIDDLAEIRTGAEAGAAAYQMPEEGIPSRDLSEGVQKSLENADTAVQQVTVGTTTTGNAGTNASVTNSGTATNPVLDFTIPRGADGANGQDGADAVNPFKGWFASANALPANPAVGDYAYVKGANASDPAAIYECTTAGTWSDSGRTADTSNVQTFASGEEVNEVHIVNDLTTGGVNDVLSAEQGKNLNSNNENLISKVGDSWMLEHSGRIANGVWWNDFNHYKHIIIPVYSGDKVVLTPSITTYYTVLSDYTTPIPGDTPSFATGYSDRVLLNAITTINIPADGKWLWILSSSSESILPTSISINGIEKIAEHSTANAISIISQQLNNTVSKDDIQIEIASKNIANPLFIQDGKFVNSTGGISENADWSLIKIPVKPNTKYAWGGFYLGRAGYYLYTNSNEETLVSHDFSDPAGTTTPSVTESPNDAAYLYIDIKSNLSPTDAYKDLQINESPVLLPYDTYTEKVSHILSREILASDVNSKPIIRLYPQTKLPCVSFQFDDIPSNDSQVVSLFESYGLTCAFAFIASESNIANKASIYLDYQKRRGFQIMNHSVDGTIFNTTNYTYQTAQEAIFTALNRIQNAGMICNGFVSPSSSMATEFLPILKSAQAYAFTSAASDVSNSSGRTSDTCDLHRFNMQATPIATIKSYIDDCITNDKIMTFYGHSADFGTTYSGEVWNIEKVAEIIKYCIGKRDTGLLYMGGTDDCVKYFFDL